MAVKSYIHLNQMYSLHKDVYTCTSLVYIKKTYTKKIVYLIELFCMAAES